MSAMTSYKFAFRKLLSYWWIFIISTGINHIGTFFFIIPGIIFSIWFMFANYILVDEGLKGTQALLRSKYYVKGHWWQVFWRNLLGYAALLFPMMLLALIAGYVIGSLKIPHAEQLLSATIILIFSLFITPFFTFYIFLLYSDLKNIKSLPTETKRSNALAFAGLSGWVVPCIIIVFFPALILHPFSIAGDSMSPTLQNQEYVMSSLIAARVLPPKRNDIIVFSTPDNSGKHSIKRVIGLPNDRIMLQNGNVYLNGQLLDESSYLQPGIKTYGGTFLQEGQEITVPQESYFVLGDNRSFSHDSREWGFVPKGNSINKVLFCYWNCHEKKWKLPDFMSKTHAKLSSLQKTGNCQWTVTFALKGFTPNSPITINSKGTLSESCDPAKTHDYNWTANSNMLVASDGTATISYTQNDYGTYTYTFTDKDGNTSTATVQYTQSTPSTP